MSIIIKCITLLACIFTICNYVNATEYDISTDITNSFELTYKDGLSLYLKHALSTSQFKCLAPSYNYIIFKSYLPTFDDVDPQFSLSILNSHITQRKNEFNLQIEATFSPCVHSLCSTLDKQLERVHKVVRDIPEFMLWLDITTGWGLDLGKNRTALKKITSIISKLKMRMGIYSDRSSWISKFGTDLSSYGHLPLWSPEQQDSFSKFGAWSSPSMYKMEKSSDLCDANGIVNAYPLH